MRPAAPSASFAVSGGSGTGASILEDLQMKLYYRQLTLEDLQTVGLAEATEVLRELGFTPLQRLSALKALDLL